MRGLLLILGVWLLTLQVLAQGKDKPTIDLQHFIERLFPLQEEEIDYEAIYELLVELYQSPLDLNRATAEELLATYLLSPVQIQSLLAYRNQQGDFLSIYELQAIPEIDAYTLENLLPFLAVYDKGAQSKPFLTRLKEEENAFLLIRHRRTWELRQGFAPSDTSQNASSRYLGGPNDLFLRFRIQHARDFSLGMTLEKDPGEAFAWDPKTRRYGFNFVSFHHTRYGMGKWKTITLGDFQASFGQGLVFGAGYTFGKGAETVPTVRRSSLGLLPYTAGVEGGFYRGLGLTRQEKLWQSSLFFSSVGRDARLSLAADSLENQQTFISSLPQAGLHRSPSELATKSQMRETSLGANVHLAPTSRNWSAGINVLHTELSHPWIRRPTTYNQFEFAGQRNQVGSAYGNYTWKNSFFFGETALSSSGGRGSVLGLISSLSKTVDFSLLWRKYDRDFHSFYATAFSESTRPINERGLYLGLQIRPTPKLKLNAYYDTFSFPWLKFRTYAPSQGYEWLGRLSYQPSKTLSSFVQFRQEYKSRNSSEQQAKAPSYQLSPLLKSNLTASLELELPPTLQLRSRVLWNQVVWEGKKTLGWMLLQEISYRKNKLKFTGRVALFDAQTFDNRLYAYEQNAVGTFAIPSFAGKGSRRYLLVTAKLHPKLTAYFRIAQTTYINQEQISSGLQAIQGTKQTDTVFLLRYALH